MIYGAGRRGTKLMKSEVTELEHARNIALQKYGRNVYNFSLLEMWLKILVSRAEISGHISELPEILNQHAEAVHNKTMGQVVKQFIEKIDSDYFAVDKQSLLIKEPYFSHKFCLEISNGELQDKKLILEAICRDRNELIHHFHERFKFASIQNCEEAIKFLDLQREECLPYFDEIRNLVAIYGESMSVVAEFMKSEEFFNSIING